MTILSTAKAIKHTWADVRAEAESMSLEEITQSYVAYRYTELNSAARSLYSHLDAELASATDFAVFIFDIYSEEQCGSYLDQTAEQVHACAGRPEHTSPWTMLLQNSVSDLDAIRTRLWNGELTLPQQAVITALARAING